MTYKTTQQQTDHIGRTGSASTRPSARGTFRDIPEWAQKPEEYFNSLTESYNIANKQLFALRSRASWLKYRLETKQASKGEISEYSDDVAPLIKILEKELDSLRSAINTAAKTSWAHIFYFFARDAIDGETFNALNQKTRDVLMRERCPPLPRLKPTKKEAKKSRNAHWP